MRSMQNPDGGAGTVRAFTTIQVLVCSLGFVFMSHSLHAEDKGYFDNAGNNFGKGRAFFHSEVLPRLAENGCLKCHARGYVRPDVTVYEELIRRLAIGDSAVNNAVVYKIANIRSISPAIPNHPGGQRCSSIDAEPCKSIRQWWEIEFGQKEVGK